MACGPVSLGMLGSAPQPIRQRVVKVIRIWVIFFMVEALAEFFYAIEAPTFGTHFS